MDILLAKIFATALVFSQIVTAPADIRTRFDEVRDQEAVSGLLQTGCAHMRKAFDIEALNLDDLIATAMEDLDSFPSDTVVLRGIDLKQLYVAYRQFCKNETVADSPIRLADVIRIYNTTLADLPTSLQLSELRPPGMTEVVDAMGQPYHQRRSWAPIEQIPRHVQQAFIAAEDKRFYEHKGIDERALVRAFIANISRPARLQGGSTITQQVVKNLLVGSDVAYERKMREMVLASRLEHRVGKPQILELYLNSIYFGRGAWGIEMASQSYFGKSVALLDIAEAAMLAGLAKGPAFFSPDRHPVRSRERTEYVLGRLREDGSIDAGTLKSALMRIPLDLIGYEGVPQGSHFADHLAREGKSVAKTDLFAGVAYTVEATIQPQLQAAAEAALQEGLFRYEKAAGRIEFAGAEINLADAVARLTSRSPGEPDKPAWLEALSTARLPLYDLHWPAAIVLEQGSSKGRGARTVRVGLADGSVLPLSLGRVPASELKTYDVVRVQPVHRKGKAIRAELRAAPTVQGSVLVLENQSGRILAMAGSSSYPRSQLNRVTQSARQPGSALKPLVYLAALQQGIQPNTLVRDSAVTYPPIGGTRGARAQDYWTPKNYGGGTGGIITVRQALESSKNVATARLLDGIESSPPQSLDHICKLGQHLKLYKTCVRYYPFVLGAQPVRPIDLAVFYATVANEGFRPTPFSIEAISRNGKTVYRHEASLEDVALADKASFYQLKTMLQGVLARGTARSLAHLAPYVAGKTGTTDGENDAWFAGFSNDVTVVVWVGYDNADGHRRTLGAGRTGGNVAVPIFEPVMQAVWAHHAPKTALKPPSQEAQRHLVAARTEGKRTNDGKAALLPERLRRDAKGRPVEAQYRLLSRKDRDAYAAARSARRQQQAQQEERFMEAERERRWSAGRGWFGWHNWGDDRRWGRDDRRDRGFW